MIPVSTAVVTNGGAHGLGNAADAPHQIIERFALELRRLLQRRIQVVHVRLVMLGVMDLHRPRVDVRLQRVVCIRKRGKGERHSDSPLVQMSDTARLSVDRPRLRNQAMMPGNKDRKITTRITSSMWSPMPGM